MLKVQRVSTILNNQRGVSAVIIGICLFMLVAFVALAIDVGHLYVVRNELQNAADAGALAGARHLYKEGIFEIDPNANLVAAQAATANIGDNKDVEVISPETNVNDVQRGHWSFNTRTFTRRDELIPPPIWGKSADELDAMVEWVNAVQVIARRESLPITSFFAVIFGFNSFKAAVKAVAYLGASSAWFKSDFDQPIAICAQSLVPPEVDPDSILACIQGTQTIGCEKLDCNIGRMLNSGSKTDTHNTAGWTNFSGGTWPDNTEDSCSTASASEMNDLVCNNSCADVKCTSDTDGFDPTVEPYYSCCKQFNVYDQIGATGGVQQVTLDKFRDCWIGACNADLENPEVCNDINNEAAGVPDKWGMDVPDRPWKMKLPVVDCPGNNVSNCPTLLGVVEVSLVWVTHAGTPDPSLDTPYRMESTTAGGGCGKGNPNWPISGPSAEFPTAQPTYDQMLSSLEATGFPAEYYDDMPVSCDATGSLPEGVPSSIPGLQKDTTLGTHLSDILSSLPATTSNSLNFERIAPTDIASPTASDIQFFDIKDPGGNAPKPPNEICQPQDYEDLLFHHMADAAGEARWASFVKHFDLKNWDDAYAPLAKKSIYFLPSCCGVEPTGISGDGAAFGIMAKVPVLVD